MLLAAAALVNGRDQSTIELGKNVGLGVKFSQYTVRRME